MNSHKNCPICLEENNIEKELFFITLDCNHSLCEYCYLKWHIQNSNPRCVICRQIVTNNQIESESTNSDTIGESQIQDDHIYMTYYALCILLVLTSFISITTIVFVKKGPIYCISIIFFVTIGITSLFSIDYMCLNWIYRRRSVNSISR